MSTCRWLLLIGLAASAPPAGLFGQEPKPVRVTPAGVLVDFQDADLALVVAALAEAGQINVVYAELPARRVTLRMQQPVPKESILPLLKSLAQSNGLRVEQEGNFVRLEPETAAAAAGAATATGAALAGETRLFVYRLKHVRSAKVAATLQALFSRTGTAIAQQNGPQAGTLSQGIKEGQGGGLLGNNPPVVAVEVAPPPGSLPGQLKGEIQIVADETTNSLLVRALSEDWDVVRQAVDALDLRPLQVLIEVVIAEVRRTRESDISLSGSIASSRNSPDFKGTLKGRTNGDVILEALRVGSVDLSATLSLLATRGDVRIISRPVVVAQNNQEARILIGSERPFVQVSRSLPTDAAVRDQVIQYRDVGTKLTLTPTINDDGYVNLQVVQEVSSATAETQFDAPVISTREASTHLFVKDGRTAVLGGLIDRQQENSRSGVPLLMDVPLLGSLFGSTRRTTSNSELFLFLTPHVITGDDDLDKARDSIIRQAPQLEKTLREDSLPMFGPLGQPVSPARGDKAPTK